MDKHFIIGLGWLGYPLANHFTNAGDLVAGTTRDKHKANIQKQSGVFAHIYDLYYSEIDALPKAAIINANVVVNIPPGRRNFSSELFIQRMKILFNYIIQNKAKHICFISTTSVFGNQAGRITNDTLFNANTPSGKAHVELERYLKRAAFELNASNAGKPSLQISVLRLAGLVGKDRHPITTLSKKSDILLGKNPVNLIHQQDVIRAISALLSSMNRTQLTNNNEEPASGEGERLAEGISTSNFFAGNLCSIEHPSKEQYYTWCSKQLGIRCPNFAEDTEGLADGKFIDAKDTLKQLSICLNYTSPYQMLPSLPK
jgi:nucleoside-diphosphate-sugar epimerase